MSVSPLQALVLGAIQAFAEFLPISSSGHLIVGPALLGWPEHGLSFDVALHVGTALALLAYFWREWVALITAFARGLTSAEARGSIEWRLCWMLLLGSIPAGIFGVLFEAQIESALRSPVQVAVLLIVFAAVLWVADRWGRQARKLEDLTWRDALFIGAAQVLALAPGVSRSGITLSAGRVLGFERADAARFSFLLATPVILGAGVLALVKIARQGLPPGEGLAFLIGMATSAVLGVVVIGAVLSYLQRHTVTVFVVYRIVAGLLILLVLSESR